MDFMCFDELDNLPMAAGTANAPACMQFDFAEFGSLENVDTDHADSSTHSDDQEVVSSRLCCARSQRWTEEEDQLLIQLAAVHRSRSGRYDWVKISSNMGARRSSWSCRKRHLYMASKAAREHAKALEKEVVDIPDELITLDSDILQWLFE
jgi:Myb-like DNA-binding domain